MKTFKVRVLRACVVDYVRRNVGEEFQVTESDFAPFGPAYLQPISSAPTVEEDTDEAVDLSELSLEELKALCEEHGVKKSGSKAEIVERLQEVLASSAEDAPEEDSEDDESEEVSEE